MTEENHNIEYPIVPYEPRRFTTPFLERFFLERRSVYDSVLAFSLFSYFLGFILAYCGVADSDLLNTVFNTEYGFLSFLYAILLVFLFSFTVFSPVVSLLFSVMTFYNAGIYSFFNNAIETRISVAVFLFSVFLYSSAMFLCIRESKFGTRKVFAFRFAFIDILINASFSLFILIYYKLIIL